VRQNSISAPEKSAPQKSPTAPQHFLEALEIADFNLAAAHAYGDLRHANRPAGHANRHPRPISGRLSGEHNTREFERVAGLELENWVDWNA
jgi:predicted nucleic acid-binding protein